MLIRVASIWLKARKEELNGAIRRHRELSTLSRRQLKSLLDQGHIKTHRESIDQSIIQRFQDSHMLLEQLRVSVSLKRPKTADRSETILRVRAMKKIPQTYLQVQETTLSSITPPISARAPSFTGTLNTLVSSVADSTNPLLAVNLVQASTCPKMLKTRLTRSIYPSCKVTSRASKGPR